MKRLSLVLLAAGLIVSLSNCQKQSDEEFILGFAKTVCYKMADCATESISKMSDAQKKQMAAYMPSHAKCDKELNKEFGKEENTFVLTSDDKALGQKCIDEVLNTACNKMQREMASCKQFNALAKKKGKS